MPPDATKLRPHIDRIAVIAPVSDPGLAEAIHSGIWTQFDDKEVFAPTTQTIGGYKVGKRINLQAIKHDKKRPLLHYQFTKGQGAGQAHKLRIEFSPVDLGAEAMSALHGILITIVPDGWRFFIDYGYISKIEVTVDIPDVGMDQVHAMLQSAPSFRTWSSKGKLETIMFGKPKGNQYRIYDRGRKRQALGQGWNGPTTVRVERILRGQQRPLNQLRALPNPFTGITLTTLPKSKPPSEPEERRWQMFCDSVAMRQVTGALQLLSEKKRPKYRQWLKQHEVGFWDPDEIWNQWSDVLEQSNLINRHAWK